MIKKEYMEPTVTVVQLQHRQHILIGSSYTNVQSTNSTDDDNPDYGGYSSSSIWDAN